MMIVDIQETESSPQRKSPARMETGKGKAVELNVGQFKTGFGNSYKARGLFVTFITHCMLFNIFNE